MKVLKVRSSHKNSNSKKKQRQFSIIFILASQYCSHSVLLSSAEYKVICFYRPSLTTGRTWCSPKPHKTGTKQPMNCKTKTKQTWLGEIVCSLAEDSGKNICKGVTFRSECTYQKIIINAIMFLLVAKEIYRPDQFLFIAPCVLFCILEYQPCRMNVLILYMYRFTSCI